MRELVWKNTVSVLATRPCWRSFFAERVAWAVTACASTSNVVMGVPEDRVTAMPFLCGGTSSKSMQAMPRSSATSLSRTTVTVRRDRYPFQRHGIRSSTLVIL